MIKNIKLTHREKTLLMVLAIVVTTVVIGKFVLIPTMNNYYDSEEQLQTLQKQNDIIMNSVLTGDELLAKLEETKKEYKLLNKKLPSKVYQDEIIIFLDELVNVYNLDVTGYSFSDTIENERLSTQRVNLTNILQEYETLITENENAAIGSLRSTLFYAKKDDGTDESDYSEEISLDEFTVNLTAFGTYKDLKGLFRFLEENQQKILIKGLSVTKDSAVLESVVTSISLGFSYYDDGTGEGNRMILDYPRTDDVNPFTFEDLGYTTEDEKITNVATSNNPFDIKVSYDESDFYLVLKPETSDANNVALGKTPDRATALYVNTDSSKNVEIRIRQNGKKLSYNYGTSNESYPGIGLYNNLEMSNDGKIIIEVQSQKRLPNNDINGVSLNIDNESEYPVYIHVFDDDSINPRLIVKALKGTVSTVKH